MRPTATRGAQHNYSKPENWDDAKDGPCGDLQVRKELYGQRGIIQCVSTWKPSAEELRMLNAGGVVECAICALDQPPCALYAVMPVESLEDQLASKPPEKIITINEDAHGHG